MGLAPAVFIGDVALDEYFTAGTWPMPGNKGLIKTESVYTGGSIANAARVHAGLGGPTEFISLLNESALTDRMLASLGDGGVGITHMLYDNTIGDPRNLIFLVGGEHVVLTPDVDPRPMRLPEYALQALAQPGFVYITLNRARRLRSAELSSHEVLATLRTAGRRIVFDLDVDGFDQSDAELIDGAHIVMMNDRGFTKTFGDNATKQNVRTWLSTHRVDVLLHSRAAAGATAYTGARTIHAHGYDVPVRDVTGAGDTLGGALVFALSAGWPLPESVDFAIAAASRSVMHLGPNGGVATIDEVQEFAAAFAPASRETV